MTKRKGLYRESFTEAERALLPRALPATPLEEEAELLQVLVRREMETEKRDAERVARLIDRLVRIARMQQGLLSAAGDEATRRREVADMFERARVTMAREGSS
jgi:signal transduction histidine kinase